VNQTHNTDTAPWWQTELRAIEARQRSYLKARVPALSADDLKKLTIMDWLHQDLLFKAGLQVEADIVIPVRLRQNNLSVDYTD